MAIYQVWFGATQRPWWLAPPPHPALVCSISASTFFASKRIYLKGLSHTKMDTKQMVLGISWTVLCTNECLIHMLVRGEGRKEQESFHETPAWERGREGETKVREEFQSSADQQTFPQRGQCCASTLSRVVDIRRIYLLATFNTSTATKELIYGWPQHNTSLTAWVHLYTHFSFNETVQYC